jgi:pyruvate/2-oxoglutarate dehydrogenase complex dihydrolipoamide acyltransferase (E2) component
MPTDVLMPKLGFSMNEGTIAEWLVADGGSAVEGQALLSLESEKSVNEIESPATGILRILKAQGESHPVGTIIATIE